jgi:hypothetical protein
MKIIAYTPQGKFESVDTPYTKEEHLRLNNLMTNIRNFDYFSFNTESGAVYFPKSIVHQSVFEVVK